MEKVAEWIMRVVGLLNLLYGIFGICYFAAILSWHNWTGSRSLLSWLIFLLLSGFSIGLIVYLGYLGIRLMRKDRTAIRPAALVFGVEILYFLLGVEIFWIALPESMAPVAVGFWEMALGPIDPQIVTGDPLLGLLAMFIVRSRKRVEALR
jgi:hypothetical protein